MRNKYFFKFALNKSEPDMDAVKEYTEEYKKCLDFVKTHFMKGNKFLCGDKVSIGDMLLSSSLEQVILKHWFANSKFEINKQFFA